MQVSYKAKALEFMIALKAYAPAGTLSYTLTESATAFQQGDVGMEVLFPDWAAASMPNILIWRFWANPPSVPSRQ